MKKLTKKNFERLKEEFVELTRQDCSNTLGGASNDCLFATMATIAHQNGADSRFTADYFYEQFKAIRGYDPALDGGVKIDDIMPFYSTMGFDVEDIASSDFDGTIDGTVNASIIAGWVGTIPQYHSVILTGSVGDSFKYWDSQNNVSGTCLKSDVVFALDIQYTPSGTMGSGSLPPSGFSGYH